MALRGIPFLALSLLLGGTSFAQDVRSSFIGRWQYIQAPDTEGEVLDISLAGGKYMGVMNGLERAGEHGLFYYVVAVSNLVIAADGSIRFTVGARSFSRQRPTLSVLAPKGEAGATRESMSFNGRLDGTDLVLTCEGPGSDCPATTLRFKRLSPTLKPNQPLHPDALPRAGERRR